MSISQMEGYFEILSTKFLQNLCSFCWLWNETSKKSFFPCYDKNHLKFCRKSCRKEQTSIFCLIDGSPFSNTFTLLHVIMEFIEFNSMCKYMKKIRSSQASISINSCTELSKTVFPVSTVNWDEAKMKNWRRLIFFIYFHAIEVMKNKEELSV